MLAKRVPVGNRNGPSPGPVDVRDRNWKGQSTLKIRTYRAPWPVCLFYVSLYEFKSKTSVLKSLFLLVFVVFVTAHTVMIMSNNICTSHIYKTNYRCRIPTLMIKRWYPFLLKTCSHYHRYDLQINETIISNRYLLMCKSPLSLSIQRWHNIVSLCSVYRNIMFGVNIFPYK